MLGIPTNQVRRGSFVIMDGDLFGIQFIFPLNPTKIESAKAANYEDHDIWGRSDNVQQYRSSGVRTFNITFPIESLTGAILLGHVGLKGPNVPPTREIPRADFLGVPGVKKVRDCVNFLHALTFPREFIRSQQFAGGPQAGPPAFLFVWGDFFSVRCIMRQVSVEATQFDANLNPMRTEVRCTFSENSGRHISFEDRMKTGDLSPTI